MLQIIKFSGQLLSGRFAKCEVGVSSDYTGPTDITIQNAYDVEQFKDGICQYLENQGYQLFQPGIFAKDEDLTYNFQLYLEVCHRMDNDPDWSGPYSVEYDPNSDQVKFYYYFDKGELL